MVDNTEIEQSVEPPSSPPPRGSRGASPTKTKKEKASKDDQEDEKMIKGDDGNKTTTDTTSKDDDDAGTPSRDNNDAKEPSSKDGANTSIAQDPSKPKRGGSKPILKVSGISRVDNNLKPMVFVTAPAINQKNYYTDYLKKDDQFYLNRQLADEQKRQKEKLEKEKELQEEKAKLKNEDDIDENGEDGDMDDEEVEQLSVGGRTIVVHLGSRNLRIGLASQVYPKTIPNVIAHKVVDDDEDDDNDGTKMDVDDTEEKEEGQEEEVDEVEAEVNGGGNSGLKKSATAAAFKKAANAVRKDLRERMRFYKRRIIPNSHDLVVSFNGRQRPEIIPEHNDVHRIDWTDVIEENEPSYFIGEKALKLPPDSSPKYKLFWPIQHGAFNEKDYSSAQQVLGDLAIILVEAFEQELNISIRQFKDYNAVIIIPDLYERSYVTNLIELFLEMGFANICIQQEAMAATFGAGISSACIIDVGAQKTSITCVEEGVCLSDSRVNLKYGGDDITVAFIKFLLQSKFPYKSIDLQKNPYDWTLADDLKRKFITANDADIAIQLYSFYQRSPDQPTEKYDFKTFDEPMLCTLGLFYPDLFEQESKLLSKYKLFPRSFDVYDGKHNDPLSDAQINLTKGTLAVWGLSYIKELAKEQEKQEKQAMLMNGNGSKNGTNTMNGISGVSTPISTSATGTPAPESNTTVGASTTGGIGLISKSMILNNVNSTSTSHLSANQIQLNNQFHVAETLDPRAVINIGLDHAIIESITQAAAKSTSSKQSFYDSLMIVGGGASKIPGFSNLLTDRVGMWRNQAEEEAGDTDSVSQGEVSIMPIPREMDPSIITWKGGSVLAKLKIVDELWISAKDWDLLGSRTLQYKTLFNFY